MRRPLRSKHRPDPPRSPHQAFYVVALLSLWGAIASAGEQGGSPSLAALRVVPPRAVLRGPDAVQQLAVERIAEEAPAGDFSGKAEFSSSDSKVATVDAAGMIAAKGD